MRMGLGLNWGKLKMKIKPLEWTEHVNTETQKLTYLAHFMEIGSEYNLGFEITQKHGKYQLILQNYNVGSDYHCISYYEHVYKAKEAAQKYAEREIKEIMERFVK